MSEVSRDMRIVSFARSAVFERLFKDGMGLVEETAAYLDGPGRAEAKRLAQAASLAYAGESMRLTTRLMQVASWLLVQRAVREGEIGPAEAAEAKYRLAGRPDPAPKFDDSAAPESLKQLSARAAMLYERARRLDETVFDPPAGDARSPVASQLARLNEAMREGGL